MLPWDKLSTLHFWFNPYPGPVRGSIMQGLLILFGLLLIAAIILAVMSGRKQTNPAVNKLFKKLQNYAGWLSVFGFVILFFFAEQIPYLAGRFWTLIWLLVAVLWLGYIGRWGFIELPRRQAELAEQQRRQRYINTGKKK